MKDAAAAALFNNTLIGYEEVRQPFDLPCVRRGLHVQVRACLPPARPPVCACQRAAFVSVRGGIRLRAPNRGNVVSDDCH